MGQMTTIKDIALTLLKTGKAATVDNARKYVEKHYDDALPAYFISGHADLHLLDALMTARTSGDFDSAIKATLKVNEELDRALEEAANLIHSEWLDLEYENEDQSRESFELHQWYGDRVRPIPTENPLGIIATDQTIPF